MYLLDTHILLWALAEEEQLSMRVREILKAPENQLLVSMASLWEISIKASLGKLSLFAPNANLLAHIEATDFSVLPIHFSHTVVQHSLPFYHKDPFDRLLVAQAISLSCPILSKDKALDSYLAPYPKSPRIW